MVLIVTRFVDSTLLDNRTPWLEKAFELLVATVAGGNRIADHRMRELHRLDEMLAEYAALQERAPLSDQLSQPHPTHFNTNIAQNSSGVPGNSSNANPIFASPSSGPVYPSFSDEGSGFGDDLTAEQILAVAESMDIESTDWLSFDIFDNNQHLDMVDPALQ
jgi:proline utilization trans-activator